MRPAAISACSCVTVNSLNAVGAAVAKLPPNVAVRATTTDGTNRMIVRIASTFLSMLCSSLVNRAGDVLTLRAKLGKLDGPSYTRGIQWKCRPSHVVPWREAHDASF